MRLNFSRPLNNNEQAERFFREVLGIRERDPRFAYISKVLEAELALKELDDQRVTLNSKEFRRGRYASNDARLDLCEQVVNECLTIQRLKSDDNIVLGRGGCVPMKEIQQGGQAFIILGPPASGKSYVSNIVADHFGAYLLDSDFAKRKLPEYGGTNFGAHVVHEESNQILFGSQRVSGYKSVLELVTEHQANLVMPKIGGNLKGLLTTVEMLGTLHYDVHLTLVYLDRAEATNRALNRFISTGRYVPLSYVFDICGNNPIVNYFLCKLDYGEYFKSFGMLDNYVPKGRSPKVKEYSVGNPATLFAYDLLTR